MVGQSRRGFLIRKGWAVVAVVVAFIIAMLGKIGGLPDTDKVFPLPRLDMMH
jgi:hypothetical protein